MSGYAIHVCNFDALPEVRAKTTYKNLRAAALKVGRFSVFEATANRHAAALFTRLCKDPTLEIDKLGFPWTGVRLKAVA